MRCYFELYFFAAPIKSSLNLVIIAQLLKMFMHISILIVRTVNLMDSVLERATCATDTIIFVIKPWQEDGKAY